MIDNLREQDLQKRLRADDKSALTLIYKSYKSEFLNFSKRYDLSDDDALDIYQDSIVAMYQNFVMQQLELYNSSIKTYLFAVGKHKIYKVSKNNQKLLELKNEVEEWQDMVTEDDEPNYYQKQLSRLLITLSESCQELLRLYYYRNLTVNEIVESTHYKDANTVKSHKSRCLKRLKSLVNSN